MENLEDIRARVQDLLEVDEDDTYHSPTRIDRAINDVLQIEADALAVSAAQRRYMKRVADLSADSGFNSTTLVWTLPADFRRPHLLIRSGTKLTEVKKEEDFGTFGQDGFMVIGRELQLTDDTDATDLEVWYIYKPPAIAVGQAPDWVEGYELYLAQRAAAARAIKGDHGDPRVFNTEADRMWPKLLVAARQTGLPTTMTSHRGAQGEDWY